MNTYGIPMDQVKERAYQDCIDRGMSSEQASIACTRTPELSSAAFDRACEHGPSQTSVEDSSDFEHEMDRTAVADSMYASVPDQPDHDASSTSQDASTGTDQPDQTSVSFLVECQASGGWWYPYETYTDILEALQCVHDMPIALQESRVRIASMHNDTVTDTRTYTPESVDCDIAFWHACAQNASITLQDAPQSTEQPDPAVMVVQSHITRLKDAMHANQMRINDPDHARIVADRQQYAIDTLSMVLDDLQPDYDGPIDPDDLQRAQMFKDTDVIEASWRMSREYLIGTIGVHTGYIRTLERNVAYDVQHGVVSQRMLADLQNMRDTLELETCIAHMRGYLA